MSWRGLWEGEIVFVGVFRGRDIDKGWWEYRVK